jgi:hypothetical protein
LRTKTLLLSAAALLAAGFVSSQAQPVYSQNIVGYANVPTVTGGNYYMLTVPFVIGASNGINEVFGNTLPSPSSIYTWSAASQKFVASVYDNSDPIGAGTSVVWYNQAESAALTSLPTLPVGQGFFLVPGGPVTNVFAGTVAVNIGTSNNMVLATGGNYYMIASAVPYAGAVTNGNSSGGGPNLNNLPSPSSIYQWNPVSQKFVATVYDNSDPIGAGTSVLWYNQAESAVAPVPTINVGDAFFIVPGGSYTWTTGL